MHRMTRTLRHHMSLNAPPSQRQIPDQVKHLVPHIFITEAQRAIFRSLRREDDRMLAAGSANQAHVTKLSLVGFVPEGSRRRDKSAIRFGREIDARLLPPDRRREVDPVLD